MANYNPDEENKFSAQKMLWVTLLLIIGFQLYIITRPAAPVSKPSQAGLLTQIAPSLSGSKQTNGISQSTASATNASQASSSQVSGADNQTSIKTEEMPMAFKVSGRINKLFFEERAMVKQGDVLATLDPAPFEKSLADARVRLKVAQEQEENTHRLPNPNFQGIEIARSHIEAAQHIYDVAREELIKHKSLFTSSEQTDNVDQDNIQNEHDAKLDLERAYRELAHQEAIGRSRLDEDGYAAAVQVARNSLDDAEYDLDHTKLLAPSDGTIISRNVETGAILPSGATVYTIAVARQ